MSFHPQYTFWNLVNRETFLENVLACETECLSEKLYHREKPNHNQTSPRMTRSCKSVTGAHYLYLWLLSYVKKTVCILLSSILCVFTDGSIREWFRAEVIRSDSTVPVGQPKPVTKRIVLSLRVLSLVTCVFHILRMIFLFMFTWYCVCRQLSATFEFNLIFGYWLTIIRNPVICTVRLQIFTMHMLIKWLSDMYVLCSWRCVLYWENLCFCSLWVRTTILRWKLNVNLLPQSDVPMPERPQYNSALHCALSAKFFRSQLH